MLNSSRRFLKFTSGLFLITVLATPAKATISASGQNPTLTGNNSVRVAQGYYDSCPKAEAVHVYETASYWVSICKGMDGELFYRGVNKRNRSIAINLNDVLVSQDGVYRARNLAAKTFYDISPKALVVTQKGKVIFKEPVIRYR